MVSLVLVFIENEVSDNMSLALQCAGRNPTQSSIDKYWIKFEGKIKIAYNLIIIPYMYNDIFIKNNYG